MSTQMVDISYKCELILKKRPMGASEGYLVSQPAVTDIITCKGDFNELK